MARHASLVAAAFTVAVIGTPAAGQTLAERAAHIQKIKKKKEQEAATSKVAILQALLWTDLDVRFDRTPVSDVFDYLGTALGINLKVRSSEDAIGHGVDLDTLITLEGEALPALVILEEILEDCSRVEECTWQVRDGFLEVGTKERLGVPAAREVRWYPVEELLFEAPKFSDAVSLRLEDAYPWSPRFGGLAGRGYPGYSGGSFGGTSGHGGSIRYTTPSSQRGTSKEQRAESLIDFITDLVEPSAWTRNGGEWATIHYRDGALVIKAPAFIQRQIFGYPNVPAPQRPGKQAPPDDAPRPVVVTEK